MPKVPKASGAPVEERGPDTDSHDDIAERADRLVDATMFYESRTPGCGPAAPAGCGDDRTWHCADHRTDPKPGPPCRTGDGRPPGWAATRPAAGRPRGA